MEQVLFEVHWLNFPCSLKISSSFGDDSTIKILTERNFPRRMPHTEKKSEPSGWFSAASTIKQRETGHIIVRTSERDHAVLLGL